MYNKMIKRIIYEPPVFKNFGEDYIGRRHFLTRQDEWKAKHRENLYCLHWKIL